MGSSAGLLEAHLKSVGYSPVDGGLASGGWSWGMCINRLSGRVDERSKMWQMLG